MPQEVEAREERKLIVLSQFQKGMQVVPQLSMQCVNITGYQQN